MLRYQLVKTEEDKLKYCVMQPQGSLTFPANFMLVAAMNPCACGYYGDPFKECKCSMSEITRYQKRMSGPLLDRIDIFIEVPRVDYEKLIDDTHGENSEILKKRIDAVREIQIERFDKKGITLNSEMTPIEVKEFCKAEPAAQSLLKTAMHRINFTARAFHRILKLARTISDLEESEVIKINHLAEALQYRRK